ncbi:GntR family transcriptional regulator [Corallococcus macrosporus]|uniref:GntR family transcriptional regulator n=1 Tax=Corallococcus macrosporus TaxID=35 RepID=A0ABS3DPP8_9BACT|nr:GntR family transcriptional regulator [Corallococcus macrosporus]MBN8233285.1 GntR family transcriptional regulator [Corallococcus macrosporus]
MERVGRVAYVEEQLERYISLGMLPRGQFASEEKLAGEFKCCRGTVREAFRRLAARGLVVQHPGRKTRAVALGESLTLENLGLALHHRHTEEGRRLFEGFFSLKRQVLVELLADCCTKASASQVGQLESICYALSDAARWEPGARCAELEFELLRLAAHAAARPGHLLLIQSLQRALRGNAARLLSFMGGDALREWARCAMHALGERDVRTLQHQLPALLKACDEGMLDAFAPVPQEPVFPEAPHAQTCCSDASSTVSRCDEPLVKEPCVEEQGLARPASATDDSAALAGPPGPHEPLPSVEPDQGTPCFPTASVLPPSEPEAEHSCAQGMGEALGNRSDWDASCPEEALQPTPPPSDSRRETGGTWGFLGRWALRVWRFVTYSLGPPPAS